MKIFTAILMVVFVVLDCVTLHLFSSAIQAVIGIRRPAQTREQKRNRIITVVLLTFGVIFFVVGGVWLIIDDLYGAIGLLVGIACFYIAGMIGYTIESSHEKDSPSIDV